MANKLILNDGDQTVTIGFDAEVVGSNAAETVIVSGGADVSFGAGASDRVEVAGNLADYTVVANGANGLTLTHSDGSVINLTGLTTTGSTIAFADGSAPVAVNLDTTSGTLAPTLGGVELNLDGTTALDSSAVTLDGNDGSSGNNGGGDVGQTYTLAASSTADIISSGSANDTFDATTSNSLQNDDILTDASTTDTDVLNATVTAAGTQARIQNVETLNIDGQFLATGLDLLNVTGADNLNLNTGILSGTATVLNASSLNALNVNAGDNIANLNVTASAAGTRDTVFVNGNNATSVTAQGGNGVDNFDVTVASGSTATLNGGDLTDNYKLNVSGGTVTIDGDASTEKLEIANSGSAVTVTIDGVATDNYTTAGGEGITLTGDQDITLVNSSAHGADLTSKGLTDSTTAGTSTLKFTSAVGGAALDLEAVAVDVVELNNASNVDTNAVTVNTGSTVNVTGGGSLLLNVDDAASSGATTNTLQLNLSNDTTAVTTGSGVQTVVLEATPDEASDTANNGQIDLGTLTLHANTTTVVAQGAADLAINALANGTNDVFAATSMTGKLTIGSTAAVGTIVGGTNDDTLTVGNFASTIHAGEGNDTVTGGTGADTINGNAGNDTIVGSGGNDTLNGNEGNDTITGGAAADTINGGEGNDVINGGGDTDAITLGAGNDTVEIAATQDGDTISDFVIADDTIILTGSAAGATTITVADATNNGAGAYTEFGTAHDFTLTGVTATDLTDAIQLGRQATGTTAAATFTLAASSTLTAGSANDHITAGSTAATINAGAGNDVIVTDGTGTATLTGGEGADTFTVAGTGATTITDFGGSDVLVVNAVDAAATVTVTSDFTATAATMQSGTGNATDATLNLNDGVDVDLTLATMASAANGFTVATVSTVTQGATITGSRAADTITGSNHADTLTGGEGADTITGGQGADSIVLTESVVADDILVFADTGADSGITVATGDTVTSFDLTTDAMGAGENVGDLLDFGGATAAFASDDSDANVTSVSAAGLITFANANLSLDELLTDAFTTLGAAGEAAAFVHGGNTYVVYEGSASDGLITLTGVTASTGLVLNAGLTGTIAADQFAVA